METERASKIMKNRMLLSDMSPSDVNGSQMSVQDCCLERTMPI